MSPSGALVSDGESTGSALIDASPYGFPIDESPYGFLIDESPYGFLIDESPYGFLIDESPYGLRRPGPSVARARVGATTAAPGTTVAYPSAGALPRAAPRSSHAPLAPVGPGLLGGSWLAPVASRLPWLLQGRARHGARPSKGAVYETIYWGLPRKFGMRMGFQPRVGRARPRQGIVLEGPSQWAHVRTLSSRPIRPMTSGDRETGLIPLAP